MAISRIALEGLPHSEIFGSKPVCGSPKLIAAYHVLHRRPAPRHPPYALSSLTTAFTLLKNAVVVRTTSLRAITSESSVVNEPRARSSRSGAASDTTARASPKGSSSADVRPRYLPAGGADRARTGDPLVANQVLSQLSYSPEAHEWWA
jgi:hypothetical protein